MKSRLLLFITLAAALIAQSDLPAQRNKGPYTIEWGDAAALPKRHHPMEYFAGEGTYYQLTQSKKLLGLINYDKNLNENGNSIMAKPKSRYMVFENLRLWNNTPLLFFSDYDKKNKSEKLLLLKVDPKMGDLSETPEEILASDGKIQPLKGIKFHVVVPDKGEDMLVYYMSLRVKRDDHKNKDRYTYAVYGRDMTMKWSKEVKMPFVEANMRIVGHRILNNKVYTFCYTRKSGKGDEFDNLAVLEISENSDELLIHKIESPSGYLSDVILSNYSEGDNIVFTGLLRNKKGSTAAEGYFVGLFDPENPQATEFRTFKFSQELIAANESERAKRKMDKAVQKGKDPGMPFLQMRNILRRSDGGYYIVMEQYFLYVQRIKTGNVTVYVYHYHFMDALVSSISKGGEEEWIRKIPKYQYFVNSTFLSGIGTFLVDDKLVLLYNDHNKNKNLREDAVPATFTVTRDGVLMGVEITPEGEVSREVVTDLKDEQKVISPSRITEISEGVYFGSGKEYKDKSNKKAISSRPFLIRIQE
ncbi:MAG: hypothetical protein ACT6QS_10870 [Flavobacteriales bacterium]